tara:strand:+ start:12924 stop:13100 length:177 start_codon:yes stop_codon:yes gene_type:complete
MTCSICNGPLVWMGTLGDLFWSRCRNCGMDQTVAVDTEEYEKTIEFVEEVASAFADVS